MEDYRDRIREHEFTWSPEAWTAMESLMEQELPITFSSNGKTWWKQILGNTFNVLLIGVVVVGIKGNTPAVNTFEVFQERSELVEIEHKRSLTKGKLSTSNQVEADNEETPLKLKPKSTITQLIPKRNKQKETKRAASSMVVKSNQSLPASVEKQAMTFETESHISTATSSNIQVNTPKVVAPINSTKIVLSISLLKCNTTTYQKVHSQSYLALMDTSLELSPRLIKERHKSNEIQLGAGPSKFAEFEGWQIGLEALRPLGKRIDLGGALSYKLHDSSRIGPDFTGQSFWKRHTIVEGEVRLYWKTFHKGHHKLRTGAGVGIQFFNNYEVKVSQKPSGIDVFRLHRATWRASTQLMIDYRYYLNGPYHLGIQTGVQPFNENALYLKISAGFRW